MITMNFMTKNNDYKKGIHFLYTGFSLKQSPMFRVLADIKNAP